ncbi:hypothetical protein LXL04_005615 [Taraxacum kok-saghyz]
MSTVEIERVVFRDHLYLFPSPSLYKKAPSPPSIVVTTKCIGFVLNIWALISKENVSPVLCINQTQSLFQNFNIFIYSPLSLFKFSHLFTNELCVYNQHHSPPSSLSRLEPNPQWSYSLLYKVNQLGFFRSINQLNEQKD